MGLCKHCVIFFITILKHIPKIQSTDKLSISMEWQEIKLNFFQGLLFQLLLFCRRKKNIFFCSNGTKIGNMRRPQTGKLMFIRALGNNACMPFPGIISGSKIISLCRCYCKMINDDIKVARGYVTKSRKIPSLLLFWTEFECNKSKWHFFHTKQSIFNVYE